MKQERSVDKPGSEGYTRICADCGADMHWEWGRPITYFECVSCHRIEPCPNIVIDRTSNTVTIEDGNKRQIFAYRPEEFEAVLASLLTKP